MAKLINKYAENVMIRSVNRLINKYGHDCVVTQERTDQVTGVTPSKVLFGRYAVAFAGGSLVINNHFKLRIRADAFPYPLRPFDRITVNGVDLVALNARKISPDGATAVVWEVEADGAEIPADGDQVEDPSVVSPMAMQAYYPYVSMSGGMYSIQATSTPFQVDSGSATWVSSDWEIYQSGAPDPMSMVVNTYGLTSGFTWVTMDILELDKNYWIRVRHNYTDSQGVAHTTDWSALNLFSLGAIQPVQDLDIHTPTIDWGIYPPDSQGYIDFSFVRWDGFGTPTPPFKIYPPLSQFISDTGKTFVNTYWQIATDNGFVNLVYDGPSETGGYDVDVSEVFEYSQLIMTTGFTLDDDTQYFIRGKYLGSDSTESQWSNVQAVKILGQGGGGGGGGGTVDTPTFATGQFGPVYYTGSSAYEYDPSTSGYKYKPYIQLNPFSSPDGLSFDHHHWQFATDSAFTSIFKEVDSEGGYDADTGYSNGPWNFVFSGATDMSDWFLDETQYYVRAKMVATDGTESEWSATQPFKIPY